VVCHLYTRTTEIFCVGSSAMLLALSDVRTPGNEIMNVIVRACFKISHSGFYTI
jgi:hypothetical protein